MSINVLLPIKQNNISCVIAEQYSNLCTAMAELHFFIL